VALSSVPTTEPATDQTSAPSTEAETQRTVNRWAAINWVSTTSSSVPSPALAGSAATLPSNATSLRSTYCLGSTSLCIRSANSARMSEAL